MIELRRDWSEVVINMQKEVGKLMDNVVSRKPPTVRFSPRTWEPAIDVYETNEEVVVRVEIAGIKEDEVEVIVHNNTLIVRGDRKDTKQGVKRTYSQLEILWGPFDRDITLPARVDVNRVKAFYDCGILEVVLPKIEEEKPHHINIRVG